ncbi:hypothetical protein HYU10_02770 [Candidatus Woesearchaeota archaeon]|nr:hypothetical protein [Candidatus Woesearchaeota archaeon]MBI2661180.1 hypothetical protein [Candidatus Woesearchaeota archaeon]
MRFNREGKEHIAIKEIALPDGTIIGVFEGNRGANKDHDILIKYQEKGKRLRTPKHIHWVIDLLIKKEHNKELTIKFMKYLREMYDRVEAFTSKEDRKNCNLKETALAKLKPFEELNRYGEYKVEFIGHLIELMIKMEKNTPPEKPARVFKELMDAMIQEKEIFVIVSKATQIGG